MPIFQRAILTHGGAGSDIQDSDGPQSAAKVGMDLLRNSKPALNAVVHAVRYLEDDPRFNAGLGSQLRADGCTIQMDASCMTSSGEFGAVAGVEGIQNPVDLAQGVLLHSPYILLVGDGARFFAEEHNIPLIYIGNPDQRHTRPPSCDTVGAVAFDGTTFAAALSSGGWKKRPSDEWVMCPFLDVACFVALREQLPAPEMVNLSPLKFWPKKFTVGWKER